MVKLILFCQNHKDALVANTNLNNKIKIVVHMTPTTTTRMIGFLIFRMMMWLSKYETLIINYLANKILID